MDFRLMYPGFKPKAITFSYDDGVIQDLTLIPIMNKYGLKGTFNLNSGLQNEKKMRTDIYGAEIDCSRLDLVMNRSLYDGMEVASHFLTHPFMEKLPLSEQEKEVEADKKNLEDIFHREVVGAAYPYGTYDENTLQALKDNGLIYARTVKSTYAFHRPYNFWLWHPTIHHNDPKLEALLEAFMSSQEELALFYCWGHAYEFALQHNFQIMENIGEKVFKADDIWKATNGEICQYIKAAEEVYYKKREEGFLVNPSDKDVYLLTEKGDRIVLKGKERLHYE